MHRLEGHINVFPRLIRPFFCCKEKNISKTTNSTGTHSCRLLSPANDCIKIFLALPG